MKVASITMMGSVSIRMTKLITCPMCHGNLNMTNDPNLDCALCNEMGEVTQKHRMEYVRCFIGEVKQ